MSKLESIETLRASEFVGQHMSVSELADAIQAEIDERFMELPVDADGVPIHVGDILEVYNGLDTKAAGGKVQTLSDCWVSFGGRSFFGVKSCHHVKPRTVEDVLREFAYKVCDLNVADDAIAKYAAELRMAGDAEWRNSRVFELFEETRFEYEKRINELERANAKLESALGFVRCKDCLYYEKADYIESEYDFCGLYDCIVKPDGFCAWGKVIDEC